ncbi:N-alpha-acetyltransferase 40 [Heracleum sosnowskyi]|uniref:N-alpha-acetyltransferase 40 n=1 Tax=Heracleum sosnowskyi TaxID=360622 RepID=A0AAD8MBC8_9APIA|nr:N-alpha-acetyltransferase 40 [Heracleum sosnowskyi]
MSRREIVEKKKAISEIIKSASDRDHSSLFSQFRHYHYNGHSFYLKSGRGDKLSSKLKHYIQNILKINMERVYGSEWQAEEKVKRKEMVSPEARYIFVYETVDSDANQMSESVGKRGSQNVRPSEKDTIVGFVHFRFTLEEEVPVLYVYELQLEPRVQGKGLGNFLMQLIELIARENRMSAVVLTVQKENLLAMNFYTSKLRYIISSISPSRVNQLIGLERSYEILCKIFVDEAKAVLEAGPNP